MINFIICEDDKTLLTKYRHEVEKFMINYDIDYKCFCFNEYGKDFNDLVKKEIGFKIYILDIVTKNGSGLDAARTIREEYDDWSSMIMIVTSYNEYRYEALGKRLMLVDFINKLDNCKRKLQDAFLVCLKNYDKKYKSLKYTYKGTLYNIEFRKILYIEKEPDSKLCLITTENGIYPIPGTLNNVMEKLDSRFYKCHRSMIVNTDQIEYYSYKDNEIIFKNGLTSNIISRDKKKGLFNHVRGIN